MARRPIVSVPPPGGSGTMQRMGLLGQASCARRWQEEPGCSKCRRGCLEDGATRSCDHAGIVAPNGRPRYFGFAPASAGAISLMPSDRHGNRRGWIAIGAQPASGRRNADSGVDGVPVGGPEFGLNLVDMRPGGRRATSGQVVHRGQQGGKEYAGWATMWPSSDYWCRGVPAWPPCRCPRRRAPASEAAMNSSRSPSSTFCGSERSTLVRRSFTI